ncbi:MAG: histidine ammonia-lyase [Thermoplasmata archaeon]|nr:histidine ammonia-lyase [Thermoplasmata archaeon]
MTESLPIDGTSLTLEQFLAVVRHGCAVQLTPPAREAIRRAREAIDRAVREGRTIYGVTTGFGALADRKIPAEEARALQLNLVRSHACGTGAALPEEVVRGMMLLRLNTFARGHSGVREAVADALLEMLNRQITPWVPEQGSVGASGDLVPMAHLALALLGEGSFLDPEGGSPRPAAAVLAAAKLPALQLAEKEGVSLLNGTPLMTAYLALGVADGRCLLASAEVGTAMAWDALEGGLEPLDDRIGALRGAEGQRHSAQRLRRWLQGSTLCAPAQSPRSQDPYTLRCAPQVHGSTELALDFAGEILEAELNAVSDNPIIVDGHEFLSGGNFHGQPLALALDTLALAIQHLAAFSERQSARLVDPATNRGLPPFLASRPGLTSGWMIPPYVAAALVVENSTLAHPASAMSLPTSANQEDFNSQGAWAGAKLRRIEANAARVVAIEWMIAGQALELRRPRSGGRGSEAALQGLRALVPPVGEDRAMVGEIDRVATEIRSGSLVRRVERECPAN